MNEQFSWLIHLEELRRRTIHCAVALGLVFLLLIYFNTQIYHLLALPFIKELIPGSKFIAIQITTPFVVPIKLVFTCAIFIVAPFILYQLWAFIIPALSPLEKKKSWPLLLASTLLFYLGGFFTYFIVLPLFFRFLALVTPKDVLMMPDMANYLDFIIQSFVIFGFAFEVPVIVAVLLQTHIVEYAQLVAARPYVIVGAFILGMLLTPPDVISQILLAIPLWFLFELGLLLSKLLKRWQK